MEFKHKKGQVGGGGMLSAVVVALMIPLVIIIMYVVQVNFENSVPTGAWSAAQNATLSTITTNTGNAYDMAGILPIAIVGIAVLSAIIGALAGFVLLRR